MSIIIEGCDRVGKTVFARKLANLLEYRYVHLSKPEPNFDFYWDFYHLLSKPSIFDRFHYSEWAYSYARNEVPKMSIVEKNLVDALLHRQGALTVLVTTDRQNILERWTPNEMYDLDTTLQAFDWFEQNAHQFDHVIIANPFPTTMDLLNILNIYFERKLLTQTKLCKIEN